MTATRRALVLDAIVCTLLAVLVWLLYRKVLRLWWMYDDPFLLNMVKERSVSELMWTRDYGGAPLFTPMLPLSLKGDLGVFGENARAFYAHQVASFAVLQILEYVLLRLWCSRIAAGAAVVVTMIGAGILQIVPILMVRHYIEGAILSIVAMILFVLAVRRDRLPLAVGSAVAYFVAACSKEFYVALPLLLAVIPEGKISRRWRGLVPHATAAVVYAVCRIATVGLKLTPYGLVVSGAEQITVLATLPFRLVRQFAGSGSMAGWLLLAVVVASAAVVIVRIRAARFLALAGLAAALLPLIPLAAEMERRRAFPLWLLAAAAIAFLPRALPGWGNAMAIGTVVVAIAAFRMEWPGTYRDLKRMSDEARVFTLLGPHDVVRNPLTPPTTMFELQRLTGTRARAFYDDLGLCHPSQQVGRVFEYDVSRQEVIEIGRAAIDRSCASVVTRPLQVHLHFDAHGTLHWSLGPYHDGKWAFIIGEGIAAYEVPPRGTFRRAGWDKFNVRVRYTSPQGWRTYSPWLPVDSGRGPVVFRRSSATHPVLHPPDLQCSARPTTVLSAECREDTTSGAAFSTG